MPSRLAARCLAQPTLLHLRQVSICTFFLTTHRSNSDAGTIRGDFCLAVGRNVCHGSDSVESAEKEIAL